MNPVCYGTNHRTIVGILCLCVVVIILTAGLWPFHVPANRVNWLKSQNGLEFGHHGSAVSSGTFRAADSTGASGTLEIWLEPAKSNGGSTILSFDGSAHPGEPLSLHQKGEALGIRRNNVDPQGVARTALFYLHGVLQEKKPVFLAVDLGRQQTTVYINGVRAQMFPHSMAWNDLTGRIVLANSPRANDSWAGNIFGLAMYRTPRTASQIAADYASWMAERKSVGELERDAAALYLFDERAGAEVHNKVDSATDLTIPTRYSILHPGFLVAPWKEYSPTWSYWQDVAVNIAGFIPFGFCIVACLLLTRTTKYPGAVTVALGLATSLTIELLQAFLPTRSSGMTDIITNTLGTAIGVAIYRSSKVQTLFTRAMTLVAQKFSSPRMTSEVRTVVSDLTSST